MASTRPLALVTGASAAIGASFARRLAKNGYDLIVVGRRRERLDELAAELSGATVEPLAVDLGTDAGLAAVTARAAEIPLAMLVNNAGLAHYMPFAELPADKAEELVRVNVLAPSALERPGEPPSDHRNGNKVAPRRPNPGSRSSPTYRRCDPPFPGSSSPTGDSGIVPAPPTVQTDLNPRARRIFRADQAVVTNNRWLP